MTSANLQEIVKPVSKDLLAFDKKLDKFLSADSVLITSVIKHIMTAKGKRLRPAMLFLAARSGNYMSAKVVDAALSIELIHTATLLHDDVIDESDLRRGHETVNYRWNNLVSVLMGDFLFSRAFRIMVRTGSTELIASISKATERVSFGELRQIEEASNYDLAEKEYIKIISDKTASLFATACEAGPILQKAPNQERKRLFNFGENVGIAFQIADDLLDFIGDSKRTGKEVGSDLIQGKVTMPLIYSLTKSSNKTRKEITGLLGNGINKRGMNRVLKFVTEQGGIDYAYSRAREFSEKAAATCDKLDNSVYNRTLREILQFAVARDN
ncbi:MAG: polyprenyl synthetase family protein [candidate division Zixibacteria bacterium]|nr:polyprenyl synthetase family protein [candidate division Zixibacteria bacterium]